MEEGVAATLGKDQDSRSVVKASPCTRTEEYEQAKEEAVEFMTTGDMSLLPCIQAAHEGVSGCRLGR